MKILDSLWHEEVNMSTRTAKKEEDEGKEEFCDENFIILN